MLVRCDAPHQAVNRALEFGIALSLHANTDMLDRGSDNAVRKAGSRTRSIQLHVAQVRRAEARLVGVAETALDILHDCKLHGNTRTNTHEWHHRAFVEGKWALVSRDLRHAVQHAVVGAMRRRLNAHLDDIKWPC